MQRTLFIQAPPVLGNECIEAFGGAGYVEDTGLPALLRDAQVLPIWEGTTNVLALDTVRRGELGAGLPALRARIQQAITAAQVALQVDVSNNDDPRRLQANARRIAMTMGRALELSLLIEHAATSAADATAPVDLLTDINSEDSARLIE